MNILLLHNRWAFPPMDGGMVAMSTMAEGLAGAGHQVSVFALNPSRNYTPPEKISVPEYIHQYQLADINTDINIWGALRSLLKNESYHASRFYHEDVATQLDDYIKSNDFDIVIADSIYLAPYKKVCQLPFVVRVHNVEHEIWKGVKKESNSVFKKLYLRILIQQLEAFEKVAAGLADGLIFLSAEDAQWFEPYIQNKKVIISPTSFHLATAAGYAGQDPEENTLIHIASMDWMPNVQALDWFMDEVWPLVKLTCPSARLKLAGKKMPEKYMHLKDPDIIAMGFVDDVYAFMASGCIMIVPLFSGSGIRIKIIEGMVMGKAMVVTSKAIQGLDLSPEQEVLVADAPEMFADAVVRLIANADLRRSIGNQAKLKAQLNFDLEKSSRELSEFLDAFLH